MNSRVISWFSCGAASAVATVLAIKEHDDVMPVYCETGGEHEDNVRFMADCERWFGKEIVRLRSDEYSDVWDVWEKTRWLAGINGARCTTELKVKPRLGFQKPTDNHVFGYTADKSDADRANRLRENYPELNILTPLIDAGLTKEHVLAIVMNAGIELPKPYLLGFHNNNCKTCVKATSPNYWALVRKSYPQEFERMAKLSKELDVKLCRLNGVRSFIDEIPLDHPTVNPIAPSCDFLCHLIEEDIHQLTEGQKNDASA
jgi:hypothetical protein